MNATARNSAGSDRLVSWLLVVGGILIVALIALARLAIGDVDDEAGA